MKNILAISTISAVLAVSCAPKDSKLVRPDSRPAGQAGEVNPEIQSNKHLLLLIDMQVETVHLFKALTDDSYRASKNLNMGPSTRTGSLTQTKLMVKKVKDVEFGYLVSMESDADGVLKITITEDSAGLIQDSIEAITLKNKVKNVVITRTAPNTYLAKIKNFDEINSESTKKAMLMNESEFTFKTFDNEVQLFQKSLSHQRYGLTTHDSSMVAANELQQLTLTFSAEGCASLNGSIILESVQKKKETRPDGSKQALYSRQIEYKESNVVMINPAAPNAATKTLVDKQAQDCKSRPIVDLSKLI